MKQQVLEPDGRRLQLQTVLPFTPRKSPGARKRLPHFASATEMAFALQPAEPVHCLRLHTIKAAATWFLQNFPGDVMYAVKTNPDKYVLRALWEAGVRHFDTASLAEIQQVAHTLPGVSMYYMHPVKNRESIAKAYFEYGVRHFSLDSHAELQKIIEVTGHPDDLALYVRLAIPNDKAAYSLSGKFGVKLEDAGSLIMATRKAADKFGLCFHVGSQCMDPNAYSAAIGWVRALLQQTGVKLDMLDVGGGFPSVYPSMTPPALGGYMDSIRAELKSLPVSDDCRILCEPGRALVAESGSLIVRVDLRKGNMLYINDGTYGSLFDAGTPEFNFPVHAIRVGGTLSEELTPFGFFGPTCDSVDAMKGPFMLPSDINEGDYIEIGQMGAYGATMRTKFNGFYSEKLVTLGDEPLLSIIPA